MEYHQHQTTEFYDLGLGGNTKETLLMIITTAGIDLTYPCFTQEHSYCSKLLDENTDVINENYFADILALDKDDDIDNIENWKKANPIRMSYDEGIKKIKDDYEIAKVQTEKLPSFMTKCLNIWVQAKESGYMDMSKWKECEVEKISYDLRGKEVYVGLDMSAKIDLTSVAFIIPIQEENEEVKYVCYSHSFIPNREKLIERTHKDKVSYEAWEMQGFLSVTDSPIVDQQFVIDYINKTCEENDWKINTVVFDPANASKIMQDMSNLGYNVVEAYQSHKSLNEATVGFREEVYCKNVLYTKNPLLNFAMSNAVVKTNNGLIKIDKDACKKKIDPVDSMLCAFKLAYYHDFGSYSSIDTLMDMDW